MSIRGRSRSRRGGVVECVSVFGGVCVGVTGCEVAGVCLRGSEGVWVGVTGSEMA